MLKINKIPNIELTVAPATTVMTDDIFKGRTVVLFGLPGAFTPTCSGQQVPAYNELFDTFATHGVDEIICTSVNDSFVMDAWKRDLAAYNITFLPDGNGRLAESLGMLVSKDELGFGSRSWRYSMLVIDGKIEKSFIEPQEPGDPYYVSDPETMLRHIAPEVTPPPNILVVTRDDCVYCQKAKRALEDRRLPYHELTVGEELSQRALHALSEDHKVPQIFINGERIGGSDRLDDWLASPS